MTENAADLEGIITRAIADIAKGGFSYELENLAEDEPEKLAPYLPRLLAANILDPTEMYRTADDEIQRGLVAKVDAGNGDLNGLLLALAHTRGPVPAAAFRRWREQPPPGADQLYIGPAAYMHEGGWMLEGDRVRELGGPTCYALEAAEDEEADESTAREPCQGCGSPLWAPLDLDTADERVAAALAHTGWSGRLRPVICFRCDIDADPTFVHVEPDGTARLAEPPGPGTRTPHFAPLDGRLLPQGRSARHPVGSAVGGLPHWLDDARYPTCPACGGVMTYIAQIDLGDVGDYSTENGYLTCFLHAGCGLAAVICQG